MMMMMMKQTRNQGCEPDLDSEGTFLKPLTTRKNEIFWTKGLKPYERMHTHHTLASARRYAYFRPFPNLIPGDELDFVLSSNYDHSYEFFPDTIDVYLQPETLGKSTWRRLRNHSDVKALEEARANVHELGPKQHRTELELPYKYNHAHPCIISGISEKKHPSNVKLMNSSHHSPQTNAGYSRQDSDGNVYQY